MRTTAPRARVVVAVVIAIVEHLAAPGRRRETGLCVSTVIALFARSWLHWHRSASTTSAESAANAGQLVDDFLVNVMSSSGLVAARVQAGADRTAVVGCSGLRLARSSG